MEPYRIFWWHMRDKQVQVQRVNNVHTLYSCWLHSHRNQTPFKRHTRIQESKIRNKRCESIFCKFIFFFCFLAYANMAKRSYRFRNAFLNLSECSAFDIFLSESIKMHVNGILKLETCHSSSWAGLHFFPRRLYSSRSTYRLSFFMVSLWCCRFSLTTSIHFFEYNFCCDFQPYWLPLED